MFRDFETLYDRRIHNSVKWNKYQDENIIPLWVADMDFKTPAPILESIKKKADFGILGYTATSNEILEIIQKMVADEYDWQIEQEWIILLPSLIPGLHACCNSFCQQGDEVMLLTPTYNNFFTVIKSCKFEPLAVPLHKNDSRWVIDYNRMQNAISDKTKLTIFCNPHNPVGRVYRREELQKMADICIQKNVVICSDEIHCGLILDEDKKHIPLASISPEIANQTITLMSPGKTFNLGGLNCGFAIIPNPTLRRKIKRQVEGVAPFANIFALEATKAAYTECGQWYQTLLDYLRGNRDMVFDAVSRMPGVETTHVEGTYLSWLDARGLGVEDPSAFFEAAGVGLSGGEIFGAPGFLRLNFATPRSNLQEALERMIKATNKS